MNLILNFFERVGGRGEGGRGTELRIQFWLWLDALVVFFGSNMIKIRSLHAPEVRGHVMTTVLHAMIFFLRLVQAPRIHVMTIFRCYDLGPVTVTFIV